MTELSKKSNSKYSVRYNTQYISGLLDIWAVKYYVLIILQRDKVKIYIIMGCVKKKHNNNKKKTTCFCKIYANVRK